jgi:hypothetical protein
MESSGQSEFSDSPRKVYSLTFWQNFILTLACAAGLISLVADGPLWLTLTAGTSAIATLICIITTGRLRQ